MPTTGLGITGYQKRQCSVHTVLLCVLVYGTLSTSTALKLFHRRLRPAIQFLVEYVQKISVCDQSTFKYIFFCTVRTATFMRTEIFLVITQRVVSISYRRFGTTYRFHLQGPRIQKERQQPCYESKKKAGNPSTGYILWIPAFVLDY